MGHGGDTQNFILFHTLHEAEMPNPQIAQNNYKAKVDHAFLF